MYRLAFYGLCFLWFLSGMLTTKNVHAQKLKITDVYVMVDWQHTDVESALSEIQRQTDFLFAYDDDLVQQQGFITVQSGRQSVASVLKKISKQTKLKFRQMDQYILVNAKKNFVLTRVNKGKRGGKFRSNLQIANYGSSTKIEAPFVRSLSSISGSVQNENGDPLPGASVRVKGTNQGVLTQNEGRFQITVSDEVSTLTISYIGYTTQEVMINGHAVINSTLVESMSTLDEVVVVGYGSVKKSDLTASVSRIKAAEITAFPSADVIQSLQGRASGVVIQANNGEPGGSLKVRIRGATSINTSSDPLYVVDGFPGAVLPAPEDISSIEVLKDASSTAIYGSRGSNGVIIITSKHGKAGKAKIELNLSSSFQKEISRLDLLNKDQYIDLSNEVNPGALDGALIAPNGTNWQDEIFQPGLIQNYQLSYSGGSDNINYYVSGVYYDQKGVIINSNYKRYSITNNLNIKASDRLNFGINLLLRRTDKDGIRTQERSGGINGGVVSTAFTSEPTLPVFDADGNYSISFSGVPSDNAVAKAREGKDETLTAVLQGNFFATYHILDDLSFRMNVGANTSNSKQVFYFPTTLMLGANVGGNGSIFERKFTSLLNENCLTYTKNSENHDLIAMGGYSYQSTSSEWRSTGSPSLLANSGHFWGLGGLAVAKISETNFSEAALSSFYGRISYKLFDKYLITVNARYDGSSHFTKNNKWAFFPSAAIAWNIQEEPFLRDSDLISQLKLRVSYGVTGSQSISAYQSLARLSSAHSIQNSTIVNAVSRLTAVANDNLTWESTTQSDIGLEVGFFNQRITLVADLYKKITDDLIFSQPLPSYPGYASFLNNIGSIQNQGLDLSISSVNVEGALRWVSHFNFSINRNEVLELPGGNDIRIASAPGQMSGIEATSILKEGEAVGSFYGYVYEGVYQEGEEILPGNFDQFAGGEKYKDLNGDGKITSDDRTIIGNPHPDFSWGFNNDFTFKNFDLNIFFVGSQGNDIYSFTLMELETLRGTSNSTTEALKRWTPTNTQTDVAAANIARSYHSSSRWIFSGSYTRLRNIALGYTFPRPIGLGNLRVYLSAQNILTFTSYRGYDPEVNYRTGNGPAENLNIGLDYGSYPNAKSFTAGLNITF